ncbi:hypothetical protein B0H14DRAFT_2565862 [Mycena olivaceomarginata]|nr:hypothetical protein B0H14DRAFT_2565862 [Mycena olivaceomarginata]
METRSICFLPGPPELGDVMSRYSNDRRKTLTHPHTQGLQAFASHMLEFCLKRGIGKPRARAPSFSKRLSPPKTPGLLGTSTVWESTTRCPALGAAIATARKTGSRLRCSHVKAPRPKVSKGLHVGKSPTEDALGTTFDPRPPTCEAHVHCCPVGSSAKGAAPAGPVPSSSGGEGDEILEELRALDVEQRSANLFGSLRFQLKRVAS